MRSVGKETFNILRDCLDGTVLVSTDEICASMKHIFDDTRSIVEPGMSIFLIIDLSFFSRSIRCYGMQEISATYKSRGQKLFQY